MRLERGDVVERPHPWKLIVADNGAAKGREELKRRSRPNLDRAYMAITSEPRRTDGRRHQLKGSLATVEHDDAILDQWQYEVTGSGRIGYLVADAAHISWPTWAGTGHPEQTD